MGKAGRPERAQSSYAPILAFTYYLSTYIGAYVEDYRLNSTAREISGGQARICAFGSAGII